MKKIITCIICVVMVALTGCASKKDAISRSEDILNKLEVAYEMVDDTAEATRCLYYNCENDIGSLSVDSLKEYIGEDNVKLMTLGATELLKESSAEDAISDEQYEEFKNDPSTIMFYSASAVVFLQEDNMTKCFMDELYKGYELNGTYESIDRQLSEIDTCIEILELDYEKYGYDKNLRAAYNDIFELYKWGKEMMNENPDNGVFTHEEYCKRIENSIQNSKNELNESK